MAKFYYLESQYILMTKRYLINIYMYSKMRFASVSMQSFHLCTVMFDGKVWEDTLFKINLKNKFCLLVFQIINQSIMGYIGGSCQLSFQNSLFLQIQTVDL